MTNHINYREQDMGQITAKVETITPQMAKEWLDGQENVRRLRRSRVDTYAQAMQAGKWLVTGETIQFNGSRLLNGYHRLNACIAAGVPFSALVVRGVEASAADAMDGGLCRTIGDVLQASEGASSDAVGSVARMSYAWDNGLMGKKYLSSVLPRIVIVEYARKNYDRIAAAVRYAQVVYRATRGNPTAIAATWLRLHPILRADFFDPIVSGTNLAEGDPRLALRNWMLNQAANRKRVEPHVVAAQIVKAWNFWVSGASIKLLRPIEPSAGMPEIQEP